MSSLSLLFRFRSRSGVTVPALFVLLQATAALPTSAAITFELRVEYGDCGLVTIDGGAWEDGEPITWIDWDWGDGVQYTKPFPAPHQYAANGSYDVEITAHGGSGATRTEVLTVDITNAGEPGCEIKRIHLVFSEPEYLPCGEVRINGSVWSEVGEVTSLVWDWDDGTSGTSWFPAQHDYGQDGSYTVVVTAHTDTGDSQAESLVVVITNDAQPGCELTLDLHPKELYLRDGTTRMQFRIELRDDENRPVDPMTAAIVWTSNDPTLVQVSADGWVESHGFGRTKIRATLPSGRYAEGEVHAGSLRTGPYLQYLLLGTQGEVWPEMANSDGTPVDLSGRTVEYLCNGCDPGQPLQRLAGGQFLAVNPIEEDDPLPLSLMAVVDGQWAQNWGIVHVSDDDYGLTLRHYSSENTTLVTPETLGSLDLDGMNVAMKTSELLEHAFVAQRDLTGGVWWGGGRQILAHYVSTDYFSSLPPCGVAGNPIQLGSRLDQPTLSCFWFEPRPGLVSPRWGIYFHEMGHNFTLLSSNRFHEFAWTGYQRYAYTEGLATAASMFSCEAILRMGSAGGITPEIRTSLEEAGLCWRTFRVGESLAAYVANGADYDTLDANVVDDILAVLIEEHDYGVLYRLFSIFVPRGLAYPFPMNSASEQATLFALALEEATGVAQKARFRDEWGFPVDDEKWTLMQPYVREWVRLRDPAANAGDDRVILVGETTTLDDSFAFDREGDELIYDWRVVTRPPGPEPILTGTTTLHPTFTVWTPGVYELSLTVSDSWTTGAPDTVEITVEEAPCAGLTHLTIADRDVTLDEEHEACVEIFVGPAVRVMGSASLTLKARELVCLGNDVAIESGAALAVSNDPLAGSP